MGRAKRVYWAFCSRYLGVIVMIACGAAVFKEIEKYTVDENDELPAKSRNALVKGMIRLRLNLSASLNTTIDHGIFTELIENLTAANKSLLHKKWTLAEGAHFAFTIMSTIGYGNIVPTTDLGKAICIIYSVLSIPMYLLALSAAGELKRFHIEKLLVCFENGLLKRTEIKKKNIKIIGITIFLFFVEIMIASGVTREMEEWTLFESFYFWFISISTIGFGDFVSSIDSSQLRFLLFNLFFTLVLQSGLATIFNTLTEIPKTSMVGDESNEDFKQNMAIETRT